MLSRISQLTQSISEGIENAVADQKDKTDPISVIQRNAAVLTTDTPSAEQMDFMNQQPSNPSEKASSEEIKPAEESQPAQEADIDTPSAPPTDSSRADTPALGQNEDPLLQAKLKKFAKYEEKYPSLLKAYRVEKKKTELIKLYEKVLSEHTPVESISQPQELVNYLDSLTNKNDLLKQELERVSDSLARLRKRNTETVTKAEASEAKVVELEKKLSDRQSSESAEGDEKLKAANDRVAELEKELSATKLEAEKVSELTVELEALKNDSAKKEQLEKDLELANSSAKRVPELEEQLQTLRTQLEQSKAAEGELSALKTQLEDAHQKLKAAEEQLSSARESPEPVQVQTGAKSKNKKKKGKGNTAQPTPVATTQTATHVPVNDEREKELQKIIDDQKTEIDRLNKEIEEKQATITKLEQAAELSTKEAQDIVQARETAESEVQKYKEDLKMHKDDLATAYQRQGDAERRVRELETSLSERTSSLTLKENELKSVKSEHATKLTSTDKELQTLKSQISQLEPFRERAALQTKLREETEAKLSQVTTEVKRLEQIQQQYSKLERTLALNKRTAGALETERNDLLLRVEQLESKIAAADTAVSTTKLSQDSLVRQLEEARLNLSEANSNIELLRDELAESQRQARERLQETVVMRSLVKEKDNENDSSLVDARNTIKSLTEERDQLELETQTLGKRLLRETEQLKTRSEELQRRVDSAESESGQYQQEVQRLKSLLQTVESKATTSTASDSNDGTIADLRQRLQTAETSAKEASRSNALLKRVSDDTQQRLERLQKNHREVLDDVERFKDEIDLLRNKRTSRSSSVTSLPTNGDASDNEKNAYIKNVLLGFLEHREQRKQLLPVISTLLKFEGNDEKRFWTAFV